MMPSRWDSNQWIQWGFHWHTCLPPTNHPPQPLTHLATTSTTRLQGRVPQTGQNSTTNTNPAQLPTNATITLTNQITPTNRQQGLAPQPGQHTTTNTNPAQLLTNLTNNQAASITPTNRQQGPAPQTDYNTTNTNNLAQPLINLTNTQGNRTMDQHHTDPGIPALPNDTAIIQHGTHQLNSNFNQLLNPNQLIELEPRLGQDHYLKPWGDRLQQPKPPNTVQLCLQNFTGWPKPRKHQK